MRILIQQTSSGHYLSGSRGWTNNPDGAMAFLNELRAKDYAIYHRLGATTVVAVTEDNGRPISGAPLEAKAGWGTTIETGPQDMKSKPNALSASANKSTANEPAPPTAEPAHEATQPTLEPAAEGPPKKRARQPKPLKSEPARAVSTPPPVTRVEAIADVGFGNGLFIRGQGDGLTWDQGVPLICVDGARWVWSTDRANGPVRFKLLLNDQRWSQGDDSVVSPGGKIEVSPVF